MRAPNALFWPDAAYLRHQQIKIPEKFCTKSSLDVAVTNRSEVDEFVQVAQVTEIRPHRHMRSKALLLALGRVEAY